MNNKHFLTLSDIAPQTYPKLFAVAKTLKQNRWDYTQLLKNTSLAMIFEKPSTRTRVSFEVGIQQLGGKGLFLSKADLQLSRGEPIAHTAKVMSSMVDVIMLRCHKHDDLLELAAHSSVPVINGLSDQLHPCQLLADLLTFTENVGDIAGTTICWAGNATSNMCNSYIEASHLFNFTLHIATPNSLQPDNSMLQKWGKKVKLFTNINAAAQGVSAVVTDVWQSMGVALTPTHKSDLQNFQVNEAVMEHTKPNALFMHCLPMNINEEATEGLLASKKSAVWQEAENRLHAQKALLLYLFDKLDSV